MTSIIFILALFGVSANTAPTIGGHFKTMKACQEAANDFKSNTASGFARATCFKAEVVK